MTVIQPRNLLGITEQFEEPFDENLRKEEVTDNALTPPRSSLHQIASNHDILMTQTVKAARLDAHVTITFFPSPLPLSPASPVLVVVLL